jgi:hypothetical protein
VLDGAGASLWRDAIDRRIVAQVAMRVGGVIDSQEEVGGWPEPGPPPGPAPQDVDRDGMADTWELAQGLDPADPDDRNGHDLADGYTNLELYLDFRTMPVPEPGSVSRWLAVSLLVGLRLRRKRSRLGAQDLQQAFPL